MLTDNDLEELRQERHDDYVAETRRERIETCLAHAAMLRQADAKTRRTRFTFIDSLLNAQRFIERLKKHRNLQWKRSQWRDTPLADALSGGIYALESEAYRHAETIQRDGDLLFAFEGTTVLQGVA